jgi:hypothetical protein
MGVYKDRDSVDTNMERFLTPISELSSLDELREPELLAPSDMIAQLYNVIKTARKMKNDIESEGNSKLAPQFKSAIEGLESALVLLESLVIRIEKEN